MSKYEIQAKEILSMYRGAIEEFKKEMALKRLLNEVKKCKDEKIKKFDLKFKDNKLKELVEDYDDSSIKLDCCTITTVEE